MDNTDYSNMSESDQNVGTSYSDGDTSESLWVFGYGSLVWRPNIPYEKKVVGHVKGYKRRFWQGSTDHRGIPGAPGRVVTLIQQAKEETWGIAYKVQASDVPEVISNLNHREKNGYTTHKVVFYPYKDSSSMNPFITLVYIGTELNEHYLGPAPIEDIAKQVVDSRGPTGCNTEYVLKLAESMRALLPSVHDGHLFNLEDKIKEILDTRLQKFGVNIKVSMTAVNTKKDEKCTCNFCICTSSTISNNSPCNSVTL